MEQGRLSCEDASRCPDQCHICHSCMKLLGCPVNYSSVSIISSRGLFYLIAIVLGLLLVGFVYYSKTRRGRDANSDLGKYLMEGDLSSDSDSHATPVWLAPEVPPAQFEPSVRAALSSETSVDDDSTNGSPAFRFCNLPSGSQTQPQDVEDAIWLAPVS